MLLTSVCSTAESRFMGRPKITRQLMRQIAVNTALVLAAGTVGLVIAEVAVRMVAPQQLILKRPDIWMPVDTLGWQHRPNVQTTVNTGERTVRLNTDREGFRVGERGRVDGDRRILLLGDSFMEALQVEYEQSVAGLLEQRLPELTGERIAVRNTAVGAWDPNHYLMQLRRSLTQESYDLVVVAFFLGNDVVSRRVEQFERRPPAEVHPFRLPRSLTAREVKDAWLYPINDFLEIRSHLFTLFKTRAQTLLMRVGLTARYFPPHFLKKRAGAKEWQVTAEICHELADVAAAHNTPIVFVLVPASYQVDREAFDHYVRGFDIDPAAVDIAQPNRIVSELLAARNLEVIDVSPAMERANAKGVKLYGDVDPHLSPEGHVVVQQTVEPHILRALQQAKIEKTGSHLTHATHAGTSR